MPLKRGPKTFDFSLLFDAQPFKQLQLTFENLKLIVPGRRNKTRYLKAFILNANHIPQPLCGTKGFMGVLLKYY